jgi:hypothetical protein
VERVESEEEWEGRGIGKGEKKESGREKRERKKEREREEEEDVMGVMEVMEVIGVTRRGECQRGKEVKRGKESIIHEPLTHQPSGPQGRLYSTIRREKPSHVPSRHYQSIVWEILLRSLPFFNPVSYFSSFPFSSPPKRLSQPGNKNKGAKKRS